MFPMYPNPIRSRSLDSPGDLDSNAFFTTPDGFPTIVTGGDLEATIPKADRPHVVEIDRYWTTYPYAFISICRSTEHNEYRYYVVEPLLSDLETRLLEFIGEKLQESIRGIDDRRVELIDSNRRSVIRQKTVELLDRYNLHTGDFSDCVANSNGASEGTTIEPTDDPTSTSAGTLVPSRIESTVERSKASMLQVQTIRQVLGENRSQSAANLREAQGDAVESTFDCQSRAYSGPDAREYGARIDHEYLPVYGRIAGHPAYERQFGVLVDPDIVESNTVESDRSTSADFEIDEPLTDATLIDDGCSVTEYRNRDRADSRRPLIDHLFARDEPEPTVYYPIDVFEEADGAVPAWCGLSESDVRSASFTVSDGTTLTEYQAYKLLYYLERDFVGDGSIDPIRCDSAVEDISCSGPREPVFVFHSDYEHVLTNVSHSRGGLDRFVTAIAQGSGEELSRRKPQADVTLPDGARAQLTLGTEVSDRGTNYTIRQFTDVPHTPIDLINWNTCSLEQMAWLWMLVEHGRSVLVAGPTASGKTTTVNALSHFIPPSKKIVTIEDTREIDLPHRNWLAQVTREGTGASETDITEFDLLEATLRQRPDAIFLGEVRGEEGRDLFQIMSTGHPTFTTFHANDVEQIVTRFTTDPINVSKSQFTALDVVIVQGRPRIEGQSGRRIRTISEIGSYDQQRDRLEIDDVYRWRAAADDHEQIGRSSSVERLACQQGVSETHLLGRLHERKTVLAALIANGITRYEDVAATIFGFMTDRRSVLDAIASGRLDETIQSLKSLENVAIEYDQAIERAVSRPGPDTETIEIAESILECANEGCLDRTDQTERADRIETAERTDRTEKTDSIETGGAEEIEMTGEFDDFETRSRYSDPPEDDWIDHQPPTENARCHHVVDRESTSRGNSNGTSRTCVDPTNRFDWLTPSGDELESDATSGVEEGTNNPSDVASSFEAADLSPPSSDVNVRSGGHIDD